MKRITIVAGARPNFVKIAPVIHAINTANLQKPRISYRLVHTGQHYDHRMSAAFFEELNIPDPHVNFNVNGGTQAEQTAGIMLAFEKDLLSNPTDIVVVVGDVTSTMACSIVAKKLNTKVAHIEGGIRSKDLSMPEEINRIVTDSICDYFFTTSRQANQNLINLGVQDSAIFFVGNVMIDTLLVNLNRFRKPDLFSKLNLEDKNYLVMTLHRPANVDQRINLKGILNEIVNAAQGLPIIFPVHPRTRKAIEESNMEVLNLHMVEPLSYLEFNYLVRNAMAVITDSGGITEETTMMKIPCLTLRDNTERPETCDIGTNELIGTNPKNIGPALKRLFNGEWKKGSVPELWDGHSAERIVQTLLRSDI